MAELPAAHSVALALAAPLAARQVVLAAVLPHHPLGLALRRQGRERLPAAPCCLLGWGLARVVRQQAPSQGRRCRQGQHPRQGQPVRARAPALPEAARAAGAGAAGAAARRGAGAVRATPLPAPGAPRRGPPTPIGAGGPGWQRCWTDGCCLRERESGGAGQGGLRGREGCASRCRGLWNVDRR